MVAFGNPPYSGHSSNNGEWIEKLLAPYKMEPGGKIKLQEKNPKWLNDDYVKFLRLGEYYIEKNGEGVLAYITNHAYLDNPTFRGMRWHLMRTFDDIFIIDLHGSAKKNEPSPSGEVDNNVFDIQQGVAIIVAVKSSKSKKESTSRVYHADLWGSRESKYEYLNNTALKEVEFKNITPSAPFFMMYQRDEEYLKEYQVWPSLTDIMKLNVLGFQSHRDEFAVDFQKLTVRKRIEELRDESISDGALREKYGLKDNRDWQTSEC